MENSAIQEVLYEQSLYYDNTLVKAPNYRYVISLLKASIQLAKKQNKVLILLYFSLDNLGQLIDVYGKNMLDVALKNVTERLEHAIGMGDHALYIDGNKYLVFMSINKESLSKAELTIENLKRLITKSVNIDGFSLQFDVSLGVAAYPMNGDKAGVLLNIAEIKKRNQ